MIKHIHQTGSTSITQKQPCISTILYW